MVENVHPVGASNIPVDSSQSGMFYDLNYYGIHGIALRVSNTTATQLQNIPCSVVYIQNPSGNGNIYVGGIGDASASITKDFIIYPGGYHPFPINNANKLTVIGDNNGDLIRYHVYRNTVVEPSISYTVPPPPDVTAPTVSSTTPANGATGVAINAEIFAIFSEAILPDSVTASSVTISPSVANTVFIDTLNTAKIVIDPTADLANSTVYTITWTTLLKDLAGNALAGNHAISFTTAAGAPPADTTPPTIVSKTPDSGATGVELSATVVIVFSESIQAGSVTTTNFTLTRVDISESVPRTVTLGADLKTVTITPSSSLVTSKQYSVTVKGGATGVQDLAGNDFAADSTWTFTTRAGTETIIYNVAHDDHTTQMGDAYEEYIGTEIDTTNHPLYNHKPNKVKFRARKVNNPPGNIECWILNSSKNEIKQIGTGVLASSLTSSSSSSTEMTFSDDALTDSDKLQVGQFLVIKYDLGDTTNRVREMECSVGILANCYLVEIKEEGGSIDRRNSADWAAIVYESS